MGHIAGLDQRRLVGMDASPICRVYEGVAISCLAGLHEPRRCPSPFSKGIVQRGIHILLAGSLRAIPGA
jgi:hypothetical protein